MPTEQKMFHEKTEYEAKNACWQKLSDIHRIEIRAQKQWQ